MESVEGVKKKGKGKRVGMEAVRLEFKRRCVKLRLEEGIPVSLLSRKWEPVKASLVDG